MLNDAPEALVKYIQKLNKKVKYLLILRNFSLIINPY
jgi:hypothetical protein